MKNKIKKFSKGDFQIERPEVVFPEIKKMEISEGLSIRLLFGFNAVSRDLKGIQ